MNLPPRAGIGNILHPGGVKHSLGRTVSGRPQVLVAVVYHRPDSRLNDRLCTLVAGKQRYIELGSLQRASPVIQNSIQFAVGHKRIFGIQRLPFLRPRKVVTKLSVNGAESLWSISGQNVRSITLYAMWKPCLRIFMNFRRIKDMSR